MVGWFTISEIASHSSEMVDREYKYVFIRTMPEFHFYSTMFLLIRDEQWYSHQFATAPVLNVYARLSSIAAISTPWSINKMKEVIESLGGNFQQSVENGDIFIKVYGDQVNSQENKFYVREYVLDSNEALTEYLLKE